MSKKKMNKFQEIEKLAKQSGLFLYLWRPGDGITRYGFCLQVGSFESADYIALGYKEAQAFMAGFRLGCRF